MAINIPKLEIGRFLRQKVAPLIPGGAEAAESINSVIKQVKGSGATGADLVPATQAALHDVNAEAKKRQLLTLALVAGAVVLFVVLLNRR